MAWKGTFYTKYQWLCGWVAEIINWHYASSICWGNSHVADLDTTLLSLWKFFHYWPLAVNFFQEIADAYNENQTLPVCPSTTRWASHGRACKALYEGYQMQLSALNVCFNEQCKPEALGIFMSITSNIFIATLLMLRNVFDAIAPLNLVLQTTNNFVWQMLKPMCS